MSKYQVERPRHLGEVQRIDEQTRVSDLPTAAAAHEAPELFLGGPPLPGWLLLEGAEGTELSLSVDHLFHGGSTERADQLVLEVCDAHVETQRLHIDPSEVGAEAGPLETALELALLFRVTKTRQPDVTPLGAEQIQEPCYGLRTTNWHNGNALSVEFPTTALSERFKCALVADPLNEHDRTQVDAFDWRVCRGSEWSTLTAARLVDVCQVKSLLLVHASYLHCSHAARPRPIRAPSERVGTGAGPQPPVGKSGGVRGGLMIAR